jgi:hypothetical protein
MSDSQDPAKTNQPDRTAELLAEAEVLRERRANHEFKLLEQVVQRERDIAAMQGWAEVFPEREGTAAESWSINGSNVVDPRDYLPVGWGFDAGIGGTLGGALIGRESTVTECLDGSFPPAYRTEQDLSHVRGLARWFSSMEATGCGVVETLTNYVVGPGYTYTVATREGAKAPDGLVAAVDAWLAEFRDLNDWDGDLDQEIFRATVNDGEVFAQLQPDQRGTTRLCLIPPVSITDCGDWAEASDRYPHATNFYFGVHSADHDPTMIHGYSRLWPDGTWQYIQAHTVEHYRANVPRAAKRGVSDFLPAWQWLQAHNRLMRNTVAGASELSAVAYIIEYAEQVSQAAAYSMRSALADLSYTIQTPNGSKTIQKEIKPPGSVLNVPKGQTYQPGPAGAERGISFVEIAAAVLRIIGQRFCMPEGMVSGDDSNNSYASSLTAGTRFHRYAVCRQRKLAAYFQRIFWSALRAAFIKNRFGRFGITNWYEFQRMIEIKIDAPDVDELGKLDRERILQMRHQSGILTTEGYRSQVGIDHAVEEERMSRQAPVEFRRPYLN